VTTAEPVMHLIADVEIGDSRVIPCKVTADKGDRVFIVHLPDGAGRLRIAFEIAEELARDGAPRNLR
jgi:hypothetical protein